MTELTNGGNLMLMHNDGYLYLGFRSRAIVVLPRNKDDDHRCNRVEGGR
jgi:hypothetical protein